MAIAAARRMVDADAALRAGQGVALRDGGQLRLVPAERQDAGLLGFGNLGRALLPLLRPFSDDILVHDPWIHPNVLRGMRLEPAGFDELFARSRVLFILAATTTENQGAIGARQFAAMRPGSVVVLVSRAGVVDFDALLDAAASGHIRAAIDVFPEEPIPRGIGPGARRTRCSRRTAPAHPGSWTGMGGMVVDDLEMVLRGPAAAALPAGGGGDRGAVPEQPVS